VIAMQYNFALPADYDMDIIDRRVAEKGHALDHHPPLVFKAYCVARRSDPALATHVNLYAPFYVWEDAQGMSDFLSGPGFKAVTQSFGWPSVNTWPIVLASEVQAVCDARYATRSTAPVLPFTPIDELRRSVQAEARIALDEGALAVVIALETVTWTIVRFIAWSSPQDHGGDAGTQAYVVRHVSYPRLP
jgi:uncharacterized protein DUF4865